MKLTRLFGNIVLLCLTLLISSSVALANNLPPVANGDENFGPEGTVLTGNLALNDSDPNNDVLTYSVVSGPSSGTFTLQPNGQYSYAPLPEFNGFIFITYQACDPGGLCDQATLEIAMTFVNDLPVVNDDVYYMSLNTTLTGNLTNNDTDIDIEPIFTNVLIPPAVGTLALNNFGVFTYTPPVGWTGTVTFTYRGCDPCEVCDQGLVTIFVTQPNVPPDAVNDSRFMGEDQTLSGSVATNDSDPENMTLTFSVVSGPSNGNFILNPNGSFSYTPAQNFSGTVSITYRACDPYNACDLATLVITVSEINDPPIINGETVIGNEDQIIFGNVFANDIEPDGELIFYQVFQGPSAGTINMFNDGFFSYTPPANVSGTFTVTYFAFDPCGEGSTAVLTIVINPVNDEPFCDNDAFTMQEDGSLAGNVSLNDFDIEPGTLTFEAISDPESGVFSMNSNGTFTYVPAANYFGTIYIDYVGCDAGGLCGMATITITVNGVNDAPVVSGDNFTTQEDVAVSGNVSTNNSDADGDVIIYSVSQAPAMGTWSLNANGTFLYTPAPNDNGVYTAQYMASDGNGGVAFGTVTFIVNGVNDALNANDDSFSMNEDAVLSGNVALNDSDPENDPLSYTLVVAPSSGVLSVSSNGVFNYSPTSNFFGTVTASIQVCDSPSSCEVTLLTIQVNAVNDSPVATADVVTSNEDQTAVGNVSINDSDVDSSPLTYTILNAPALGSLVIQTGGSFVYTPSANAFGVYNATYQVCDAQGACSSATLTITVQAVNDAPVANDQNFSIAEETVLNSNVSANDVDIDGGVLVYSLIQGPSSGNLSFNSNGTFVYTPANNFFGSVTFTYQACDAGGLCDNAITTIAILNVNDSPVATNDSFTVLEDGIIGGNVAINDTDADNDQLTFTLISGPTSGTFTLQSNGAFVYVPIANYHGGQQVQYQVCDGLGACDTGLLILTIVSVNDTPVANNDAFGILVNTTLEASVVNNDSDVDLAQLIYSLVNEPNNGVVVFNADGSFVYTPNEFFSGSDIFTYQACDSPGACDQAIVNIAVINNNVAPVAFDDSYLTLEENGFQTSVALNDQDENGGPLSYSIVTMPQHGTLVMSSDGTIQYNPDFDYYGSDSFTYQVCDPFGLCDQGSVTISIGNVEDNPRLFSDDYDLLEDENFSGNVAENDVSPDGDLLLYSVWDGPFHGEITLFNDGYFVYTPDPDFYGMDSIVYRACDPCGLCTNSIARFDVQFVNDWPVVSGETFVALQDEFITGDLSTNDVDLDLEILLYSTENPGQNGSFTLFNDGTFSFLPNDGWVGTETIEYIACDPCGACDMGSVTFIVSEPNHPPIALNGSLEMCANDLLEIDITPYIDDEEESVMSLSLFNVEVAQGLVVVDDFNKMLTYTPPIGFEGLATITYQICDNGSPSLCAEAAIDVAVIHHAPPTIVSSEVQPVSCYGGADGSISIEAVGVGDLTYEWGWLTEGTTIQENLTVGEYYLSIVDNVACGSVLTAFFEVEGPDAPLVLQSLVGDMIDETPGGSGSVQVSGGTEPYSFEWTNSNGNIISTEAEFGGLIDASNVGMYYLNVIDANGCSVSGSITITGLEDIENNNKLSVYPNPANEWIQLMQPDASIQPFAIYDMKGSLVMRGLTQGERTLIYVDSLSAGIYHLQIGSSNLKVVVKR